MKKKIIQILMAILFAMPGLAQTVYLENVPSAVPGPVTIDLGFSNLTNVGAITLFIEYDDVLLGYSGPGSVPFYGGSMLINTMSNHRLGLSWINTTGQNITSSVLPLEFDYLGGFSSDFSFTSDCELATSTGAPINATFYDGSIASLEWWYSYGIFYFSLGGINATVGEQISIPLHIEGNPFAAPFPYQNLNSIGLEIDFDPAKLTYLGISNNLNGFMVNQSSGRISLSWNSATGADFMGPELLLYLNFTYNGGQAELDFKSGSFVTVDNDFIASGFFNDIVYPDVPGTASLTIADVTSAGATYLELPPSGDTLVVPAQVEVPIIASGITSNAGAITLNLAYDADKLTYTGYTSGSLSGWTVGHSAGQLSFLKTNAAGMPIPDGTLLTLKFDYLNGLAPISFRPGTFLQEPDLDYIPVNLNDGSVNTVIAEITDQPDDLYLNVGETGSFTVLANDASSYQWYYREGPLEPWQMVVTGGTGNVLNLDPVTSAQNDWQYRCLLQPGDVETDFATLYINPMITNVKVILQGAWNSVSLTMNTSLNSLGYLPLSQPYNDTPWNYTGTESVVSIPNSNVVDWVLVELRSGTSVATKVVSRAGFILNDGSIVDIDGSSPLTFNGYFDGIYYLVIYHRNHLPVMSASALSLTGNSTLYDFTGDMLTAYKKSPTGNNPMSTLSVGKFGMWAGDANSNGIVRYNGQFNDRTALYNVVDNTVFSGYYKVDLNLNGIARYNGQFNDRAFIFTVVGNNVVLSQVP